VLISLPFPSVEDDDELATADEEGDAFGVGLVAAAVLSDDIVRKGGGPSLELIALP
jgi:hypothetical protein